MIPVRAYARLLVDYLRPQRARVAVLAMLLVATIALQLVNPQLIRSFLDQAIEGSDSSGLVPLALWFMGIAVAHQALSVVATYLAENIGWTATNQLRADLASHVLDLDMGFHKEHTPGEMIERIDGDVTALSNFFSAFVIRVVANVLLGVHLYHGLWSLTQTLGADHARVNLARRAMAVVVAAIVAIGNVSIPVSVLTGLVS